MHSRGAPPGEPSSHQRRGENGVMKILIIEDDTETAD